MSSSEHDSPTTDRRTFLRATAGAATTALATGLASPVAAQAFGGWFDDVPNYDGEIADLTGESAVTVETGVETANGPYGFGPPAVRIDSGTTVTFTWVSDAHNVLPEEQPDGAGWEGYEPIENTGFEYEHTFETEGVYLYYCEPHLSLGMKGAIVVGDVEVGGGDGDGGGEDEEDGGFALTPGITMVGAAVGLAILSPIAFGLFLLRRRRDRATDGGAAAASVGGTHTVDETAGRRGTGAHPVTPVAEPDEPVREIDHDEFDPVGTASLVTIYLAILVVMWLFMYFVEFLGRGPTVIG